MVGPDDGSEARSVHRNDIVVINSSAGTTTLFVLISGDTTGTGTGTGQRAMHFDSATFVPVMPRRPAARAQPRAMIDPWMPSAPAPICATAWPAQIRRFRGNSGSR